MRRVPLKSSPGVDSGSVYKVVENHFRQLVAECKQSQLLGMLDFQP